MRNYIDIHTHAPKTTHHSVANYRLGMEPKPSAATISAGIHPWDAELLAPKLRELLEELRRVECVAIGETGLDKVCNTPWQYQLEAFDAQLAIARERNLPILLHCVRAQAEVLDHLKRHSLLPAVIFHGFTGSPEQAHELLSRGHFISFGFSALKSPKTIEAIKHCPTEQLLLESDTATSDIALLYQAVAEIKGVNSDTLLEQITDNYNRIFQ